MKDIDWRKVVSAMLEKLLVTEEEFAHLCGVSRQTVSNWKRGRRNPGIYARKKMMEIMEEQDIGLYELVPGAKDQKIQGTDTRKLLALFRKLPEARRKELVNFAKYIHGTLKREQIWMFITGLAAVL